MSGRTFCAEIDADVFDDLHDYAEQQRAAGGYFFDDVVSELLRLALEIQESRAQDRDTERRLMETDG